MKIVIIYMTSLIMIVLLSFVVQARSKGNATTTLNKIDELVAISYHLNSNAPVLIKIKNNDEKSCFCACDEMDNIWICTSNECRYDDKMCVSR